MRKRDHSSIQAPLPISYGSAYPKGAKTPRHFLNLLGQFYYTLLLYNSIFIYKKTAKSIQQNRRIWVSCFLYKGAILAGIPIVLKQLNDVETESRPEYR